MAKIYRTSDRIPVKIGDITILIAPLTFDQKTELQSVMISATKDPMNAVRGARLAVKFAVKGVSGIEDYDGKPYDIKMGEDGLISDESVDELLNLEEQPKLIALCTQLIGGIPTKGVIDPATREPMKGVSIESPAAKKPKARK